MSAWREGLERLRRRFFRSPAARPRPPAGPSPAAWPSSTGEALGVLERAAEAAHADVDLEVFRRVGISVDPLDYVKVFQYPPRAAMSAMPAAGSLKGNAPRRLDGLYLHFPFCSYSCAFCYYAKRILPDVDFVEAYLGALEREIDTAARWLNGAPIETLYFGGGTPTFLSTEELSRIARRVADRFRLDSLKEWTVECSPETLTLDKAQALADAGVNRVSVGVQSMNPALLRGLGRGHGPEEALAAVAALRKSGVARINLDFIFDLPGQTPRDLCADFQAILEAGPCEVSWSQLYQYSDTPLRRRRERSSDRTGTMVRLKRLVLEARKLISEHALAVPSLYDRHQWQSGDFLGLGLIGSGNIRGVMCQNSPLPEDYIARVRRTGWGTDRELRLTEDQLLRRRVVHGFKLPEGVSVESLEASSAGCRDEILRKIEACEREGLLEVRAGRLLPSPQGELFRDGIANHIALAPDDVAACAVRPKLVV